MPTIFENLKKSSSYRSAKQELMKAVKGELAKLDRPKPALPELTEAYQKMVKEVGELRGRDLFFKWVGSGAGNGPFIELADGSVKYDLITGIGVNFFGHGNADLLEAQLDGLCCDIMQGNLGPNPEYQELMAKLLEVAGPKTRLKHCWLTTCGATANEIALKIVRQKKSPASKVFAFKGCFAGRTTALQEITDNPNYRQGQPLYGEVYHLPFFDRTSKQSATEQGAAVAVLLRDEAQKSPGKYATLEFEIVQGEGGFNLAPREFLLPILDEAKKQGLLIWIDEIQTFGRTGEVFCFQRLGLDEYVDVVTVAKLLQTGAVLYTGDLNPKPGLVSGTFAGPTSGIRAGIKALDILKNQMSGPNGRILKIEKICIEEFEKIKASPNGKHLVDYTVFGGMVAFTLFDGSLDTVKKYLFKLWDLGAAGFYAGHGPYRIRLLPPFGAMSDQHVKDVFQLLDKAISETAKELK